MDRDVPTVPPTMPIAELAERIAHHDTLMSRHQGIPIVNGNGKLYGIITRSDILRALEKDPTGGITVGEAGTKDPIVTYPEELVYDAAAKMLRNKIGRLPVVDPKDPTRLVGYIGRPGILAARVRRLEEEHLREPGWLRNYSWFRRGSKPA